MHSHLHTKDTGPCGEIIAALEACHDRGLLHKLSGGCNDIKSEVNRCLGIERKKRAQRNREEAISAGGGRRERVKEAWREIEENS